MQFCLSENWQQLTWQYYEPLKICSRLQLGGNATSMILQQTCKAQLHKHWISIILGKAIKTGVVFTVQLERVMAAGCDHYQTRLVCRARSSTSVLVITHKCQGWRCSSWQWQIWQIFVSSPAWHFIIPSVRARMPGHDLTLLTFPLILHSLLNGEIEENTINADKHI